MSKPVSDPYTSTGASASSDDAAMLCMCLNLTNGDIRRRLSDGADFIEIMATTGAGSRCTACLLDLEYYCETAPTQHIDTNSERLNREEKSPLRRRLYAWIDRFMPMQPITLSDIAPVLYGPDLRQEFCVSNVPAASIEGFEMDPLDVDLTLRDSNGRLLMRRRQRLKSGDVLWESCEPLERLGKTVPTGAFSVGSLLIRRRWTTSSIRGATRPHFLLYTKAGVGNLHTQDSGGRLEEFFSVPNRLSDHRTFLTVVNDSHFPENLTIDYPICRNDDAAAYVATLLLPPRGARAVEIHASIARRYGAKDPLFLIRIRGKGRRKVHVIYANTDLSVMSIDHLAS